MRMTAKLTFLALALAPFIMAAGPGDQDSPIGRHRPGGKHTPNLKTLPTNHQNGPSGNSNSSSPGDSGSLNFKPLLGGNPPSGGPGGGTPSGNGPQYTSGNTPGGSPPGGNPPGGNPPGGNPPGGNPPGGDPPGGDPPNWGGPVGGGPSNPPGGDPHTVPEIDPASGMGALTLLSGALVVIRGRRKKA